MTYHTAMTGSVPLCPPHVLLVMNYLNVNKDEGKIILELYVHFDSAFTMWLIQV